MMKKLTLFFLAALVTLTANAQTRENAARVLTWMPTNGPGFESGYQNYLQREKAAGDLWAWSGWTLISGDRAGTFISASLFHPWRDFDSQQEAANSHAAQAQDIGPNANLQNAAIYEVLSPLSVFEPNDLTSYPLMSFFTLHIRPGAEIAFEKAAITALHGLNWPHAILRPVTGSTDYLVMVPAHAPSDLPENARIFRLLTAALPQEFLLDTRMELGRYRAELSSPAR